jgi:Integrase zinc binding domain/Chromo (CHRromatin Organisation MOdifier) domain/RNase H-like domain found in reverse transcriptase/Integrase core domain
MFKKYQHYLRETKYPVVVKTDHRNLVYFMTTKELNARQARWAEELTKYNFRIEHVRGKENVVADALSRRPDYKQEPERAKTIFQQTDQGLVINQNADLRMIVNINEDRMIQEIQENIDDQCRKGTKNSEGVWMFQGAIIVPKRLEKLVIKECHDGVLQGHFGEARTVEKIQRKYYFPGMIKKVRRYIKACEDCQRNKEDHHKPYGKMQEWQQELKKPWQHITMDFMMGMPETQDPVSGKSVKQILVVVDRFSKQVILIPIRKDADTEEVIELLWRYIFSVFGIPLTITTDRDKIFRSEKWKEEMKEVGCDSILSTAEHQQTDGQSERKIQEIQQYLRNYLDYTQKNWIELLPKAQYAINDAYNSVTELTPHEVVFGMDSESRRPKYQVIGADIQWKRKETKRKYDKRRKDAPSLREGDRVYLRRRNIGNKKFHLKTRKQSEKLDSLKIGPFKVKKKLEFDNYELCLPQSMQVNPVFHVSRLERTTNPITNEEIQVTEEEYDVESILDKRKRKGVTEYLVRWKGCDKDEDTWEPTKHLNCPEKVQDFENHQRKNRG